MATNSVDADDYDVYIKSTASVSEQDAEKAGQEKSPANRSNDEQLLFEKALLCVFKLFRVFE